MELYCNRTAQINMPMQRGEDSLVMHGVNLKLIRTGLKFCPILALENSGQEWIILPSNDSYTSELLFQQYYDGGF